MNYKDNINYRHFLEQKVFEKKKLTDEDKWWLESNPRFNGKFDFPCYQRDILKIPENVETQVTISLSIHNDKAKIYHPVISVIGKGSIKVNGQLLDFNREIVNCNKTKILILLLEEKNPISVSVVSKSGLLGIAYQCEYYDERTRLHTSEISDGANLSYGMKRCDVSNNEFVYYCKNPSVSDDSFDSYVFSIKT